MKKVKVILLLVFLTVIGIGTALTYQDYEKREDAYSTSLNAYNQKYEAFKADSLRFLDNIKAPSDQIKWQGSNAFLSSTQEPYLSAAQGLEVHLKGLTWDGYFLDNEEPIVQEMRNKFRARFVRKINSVTFDPDFKDNGYPDFRVDIINSPTFYETSNISHVLRNTFSKEPRPYKSFDLKSCDGKKVAMDLWLVSFDITFRIEPSENHSRNPETKYDGLHPISGKKASWSRGRREFKNNDNSYGNMAVLLEFKPKNNFYIAQSDANGVLKPFNNSPKIGVGAVECVSIDKVSEEGRNSTRSTIGVHLAQGKSLSLYPSLEALKEIYTHGDLQSSPRHHDPGLIDVDSVSRHHNNILDYCQHTLVQIDPSLFGSSKFTAIDIDNLGAWKDKERSTLGGRVFTGDYYKAEFLIHLYVLGEWVVKDGNLISFEEREPFSVTKPSVWSYVFPNFLLGFLGKALGVVLVVMVLLITGSFVFPSLGTFINALLGG